MDVRYAKDDPDHDRVPRHRSAGTRGDGGSAISSLKLSGGLPCARRAFLRFVGLLGATLAAIALLASGTAQTALLSGVTLDPCAHLSGAAASKCKTAESACKAAGAYSAAAEQTCLEGVESAFAGASGSTSPAPSTAAQGCSRLPAAIGPMTKQALSLITACLGFLRNGVQKQATNVATNVDTCSTLASTPDAKWSGMSDVGSGYVSDGQTANPKILTDAMKIVLGYLDHASAYYEKPHAVPTPRGMAAAIQLTTTAVEDATTLLRKFNSDLTKVGEDFINAASSHSCSGLTGNATALATDANDAESKLDVGLAGLSSIGSHLTN